MKHQQGTRTTSQDRRHSCLAMECRKQQTHRRKGISQQAMTLIEIMVVLLIIGLVAGGAAVALFPQIEKARIKTTRVRADSIRSAAGMWLLDNPSGGCPTVEQLKESRNLDANKDSQDAWDRDFSIECEGDEITVVSPGPDGEVGTEDDIS